MSSKTEIPSVMDYAGTAENRPLFADQNRERGASADRMEPTTRVELVVIGGPETGMTCTSGSFAVSFGIMASRDLSRGGACRDARGIRCVH